MADKKNLMMIGYPSDELWGYPKGERERIDFHLETSIIFSVLLDHNREDYEQKRLTDEIESILEVYLSDADFKISHIETSIIQNIEDYLGYSKYNKGKH